MTARDVLSVDRMVEISGSSCGECPSMALHEVGYEDMRAFDDVSGQELDPKLMMQARRERDAGTMKARRRYDACTMQV